MQGPDSTGSQTKVAVAALSEQSSTAELARANNVHPSQVAAWKRQGRTAVEATFTAGRRKREQTSVMPTGQHRPAADAIGRYGGQTAAVA